MVISGVGENVHHKFCTTIDIVLLTQMELNNTTSDSDKISLKFLVQNQTIELFCSKYDTIRKVKELVKKIKQLYVKFIEAFLTS